MSGNKAVEAKDRKVSNQIGRYYDCMGLVMDFGMRISYIRGFRIHYPPSLDFGRVSIFGRMRLVAR